MLVALKETIRLMAEIDADIRDRRSEQDPPRSRQVCNTFLLLLR